MRAEDFAEPPHLANHSPASCVIVDILPLHWAQHVAVTLVLNLHHTSCSACDFSKISSSSDECGDSPAPVVPQADTAMDMWSAEAQKKRKGDVSQWGRNVAKKRATLVRSTSVTKASKRVVGAKTVSPACNCPKKCFD